MNLDKEYNRRNADLINNGTLRDDMEDREALLSDISHHRGKHSKCLSVLIRLLSYPMTHVDKFLIQQSQLREYVRAPLRDVKNLRIWHANHQNMAINKEEHKYLEQHRDLIRLRSNEKNTSPELDIQLTDAKDLEHLEETEPSYTRV